MRAGGRGKAEGAVLEHAHPDPELLRRLGLRQNSVADGEPLLRDADDPRIRGVSAPPHGDLHGLGGDVLEGPELARCGVCASHVRPRPERM